MATFYLDTCALVPRYHKEPGTEVINTLFSKGLPGSFVTSELTLFEITAVFSRELKNPDHVAATLGEASRDFRSIQLAVFPLEASVLRNVVPLIRKHSLRAPDAMQLATWLEVKKILDGLVMVCSDNELAVAASQEGAEVLNPQARDAVEKLGRYLK